MNKLTRAVKHSISVSSAVAMFRATEIIQGITVIVARCRP